MMQQPNEGPQPKSVEQKDLDIKYEVLETGEVKVTQKQTTEFVWVQREFLSIYRRNEMALGQTRKQMGTEHLKDLKKQEKEIEAEQKKLKPIIAESERLGKINYEKMIIEGLHSSVLNQIGSKEVSEAWWANVWNNTKPEKKKAVMELLSVDEQSKLSKIMLRLKRKGLIK